MDLATTAGAARLARMSLLWAGWSSWAGATPCCGTDDYATAGSGPTRQSEARGSEIAASQSTRHALRICYSD